MQRAQLQFPRASAIFGRVGLGLLLLWPNAVVLKFSAATIGLADALALVAIAIAGLLAPMAWARSWRTFWLWNAPFACLGAIFATYVYLFHDAPYSGLWTAIWSTDRREIGELASIHGTTIAFSFVLLAIYLISAIGLETSRSYIPSAVRKIAVLVVAWFALLAFGIPTIWAYPDVRYWEPISNEAFSSSYPSGTLMQAVKGGLFVLRQPVLETPKVSFRDTPGREVYIYIIGEAEQYFRWDRQLGVADTRFANSKNTIVFRRNVSQGNLTAIAVPMMLTGAESPEKALVMPTLLQYAQARGCRTAWIAANEFEGQSLYRKSINIGFSLHDATGGLDRDLHSDYDEMLLPEIHRILTQGPNKLCMFIHMQGSHASYMMRYGPEHAYYVVDRVAYLTRDHPGFFAAQQAAYDNSLLASIAFVDNVVSELEKLEDAHVFMIYTPDHGENVADDDRRLMAHGHRSPSIFEVRTPLVVWASPSFQRAHPTEWTSMRANAGEPTSTRYAFPTMLWAMGVTSPGQSDIPSLFASPTRLETSIRQIAISPSELVDFRSIH